MQVRGLEKSEKGKIKMSGAVQVTKMEEAAQVCW